MENKEIALVAVIISKEINSSWIESFDEVYKVAQSFVAKHQNCDWEEKCFESEVMAYAENEISLKQKMI